VVGIFDDPIGVLDPLTTIPQEEATADESYDWGQVRIGTPDVHHHMPQWQGTGITIAILDTGIDAYHPDLAQNMLRGYNALAGGGSPGDDNGHGTHIAGIIAATANDRGLVGVAPQASLVSVKVLDRHGHGYLSDFINGLQWVYNQRIKLINMSLGFSTDSVPLARAIKRLYDRGTIMIAAAGNRPTSAATTGDGGGTQEGGDSEEEGASTCHASTTGGGTQEGGDSEGEGASACSVTVRYPARYPWVIAVAASDVYDQIADYSLSGPEVEVTAPGGARANERILSTRWGGGYTLLSGTSQATAHVTGCIALALQRQPWLSLTEVRSLIQNTAADLGYTQSRQGSGLINVQHMMEAPR
jgi:subtilisin family serine protease